MDTLYKQDPPKNLIIQLCLSYTTSDEMTKNTPSRLSTTIVHKITTFTLPKKDIKVLEEAANFWILNCETPDLKTKKLRMKVFKFEWLENGKIIVITMILDNDI